MAHNYYQQPFPWDPPPHMQSASSRPLNYADMSHNPSYAIVGNPTDRRLRQDLNEEIALNVQRGFSGYRQQADAYDHDQPRSNAHVFIKQEPKDEVFDADQGPSDRGYMQRSSPFSLDYAQTEMSFIDWYPKGDATITYHNESGEIEMIPNLNPSYFEDRCPLLAQAFEPSRSGPKLYLEILTPSTATPFVRYLYTGSYAVPGRESNDVYEDVPTSLLLHCQIFRLADIYDLPDLKQQSYVNITRQCEFGCSSPDKPIDLCEAIKYVYQHLTEHANLIETIVCYCVTCFLKHRLGDDFEFRAMAYDLRRFQQDLVRESMKRQFEDDTASAIINLPFKPYVPETYASREDVPFCRYDVIHHFHAGYESDSASKKRKRPDVTGPGTSAIALALRQKREAQADSHTEELESDLENLGTGSSKRRASVVENELAGSDSEFEVIAGPAPVVDLSSDSESDGETVIFDGPGHNLDTHLRSLPIRRRSVASSVTLVEPETQRAHQEDADSGSESDWTLV